MGVLIPSYTVTQNIANPTLLHFTDTSTGYNNYINQRRIYLRKADGTYLVPEGTTTDYIIWDYANSTIDVDVMNKDYALQISVDWISTNPLPEEFNISATALTAFTNDSFEVVSSGSFIVDMGDGTLYSFAAGTHDINHTYSSPFTGLITIYADNLTDITQLIFSGVNTITPSGSPLKITTTELSKLDGLQVLNISDSCYLYGQSNQVPSSLIQFIAYKTNLSGSVADLPSGLVLLLLTGTPTISGTFLQLPSGLTYCVLGGTSNISGDLSQLPSGITIAYFTGTGYITGNLSNINSGTQEFVVTAPNSIAGDLSSLASPLSRFIVKGSNTITGALSSIPNTVVIITIDGDNTVSGTLSQVPAITTSLYLGGNNTVSGNISNLNDGMNYMVLAGQNTVSDYTSGRIWEIPMDTVIINPVSGGLTSTEVDNLLIDLANTNSWIEGKLVQIVGANAARTAASDAAVATIEGFGVTVTTN